ncbi:MAG: DUF2306 domain-containing protein [Alphaproteobacteria bacterium]|nr:DUF2306 domain-containing protein [Alphaproteobacteria bacterium]
MKFLKPTSWVLMSIFVIATAIYTTKYFRADMPNAFQPDVYAIYSWELRIHIAGGIIAALAGLTQFWSNFRNKHKNIHRLLGFTYIVAIAISAPAALILSTVSQGGLVTHIGFGMLAILWAFTTFKALYHITRREITLHKQWMIRSYALTFAFVLLRMWLGAFIASGVPIDQAYQTVSWLCWVPNLLIVEYLIVNRLKIA